MTWRCANRRKARRLHLAAVDSHLGDVPSESLLPLRPVYPAIQRAMLRVPPHASNAGGIQHCCAGQHLCRDAVFLMVPAPDHSIVGTLVRCWGFWIVLLGALLFFGLKALAHGPAEWIQRGGYKNAAGELCCGERDCFELKDADVKITSGGYYIVSHGRSPKEVSKTWKVSRFRHPSASRGRTAKSITGTAI